MSELIKDRTYRRFVTACRLLLRRNFITKSDYEVLIKDYEQFALYRRDYMEYVEGKWYEYTGTTIKINDTVRFHSNVEWIAPNILQAVFYNPWRLLYFTPKGKVLKYYAWKDGTECPDIAEAKKIAKAAITTLQVMPFKRTISGLPAYERSPSIRIIGYEYSLQDLMAMHFMNHPANVPELDAKVKAMFPHTMEDEKFVETFMSHAQPSS